MQVARSWAMKAVLPLIVFGIAAGAEAAPHSPRTAKSTPSLSANIFNSAELRAAPLRPRAQWTRILESMRADRPALAGCVRDAARCTDPALAEWRRLAMASEGLDRWRKLRLVNRFFNAWRYRTDPANYGEADYWASPREFMSRSGDCEDYAIAKFFALRSMGLGNEEMRIVTLEDTRRDIGHAVLAVYVDGDILILDNLSDRVDTHRAYPHYVPRVSFNETSNWVHIGARHFGAAIPPPPAPPAAGARR